MNKTKLAPSLHRIIPAPSPPNDPIKNSWSVSLIVWWYGLHQQSNDAAHHVFQETLAFHSDPGQIHPRRPAGVLRRSVGGFKTVVTFDYTGWLIGMPEHGSNPCMQLAVRNHVISWWMERNTIQTWVFDDHSKPQSVWTHELCWLWVIQFCHQSPNVVPRKVSNFLKFIEVSKNPKLWKQMHDINLGEPYWTVFRKTRLNTKDNSLDGPRQNNLYRSLKVSKDPS